MIYKHLGHHTQRVVYRIDFLDLKGDRDISGLRRNYWKAEPKSGSIGEEEGKGKEKKEKEGEKTKQKQKNSKRTSKQRSSIRKQVCVRAFTFVKSNSKPKSNISKNNNNQKEACSQNISCSPFKGEHSRQGDNKRKKGEWTHIVTPSSFGTEQVNRNKKAIGTIDQQR